jgi:hypothetical protein
MKIWGQLWARFAKGEGIKGNMGINMETVCAGLLTIGNYD